MFWIADAFAQDVAATAGPGGIEAVIQTILPLLLIQAIWFVPGYQMAVKQGMNRVLWVILLLVPIIAQIALTVLFVTTLLRTLDRLNKLEAEKSPST